MTHILKSFALVISLVISFSALSKTSAHHHPGIFLGYTDASDETLFTYGFEYEYKFSDSWGAGFVYEKIDDAHHHDGVTVKVAEAFYHVSPTLRLGIGFGEEKIGGAHPHSEDLYRLSVNYDYHLGDFALAPTLAVDFIDGEKAYVFGVAIVYPF